MTNLKEEFKLILKLPTGSLSQELNGRYGTFKEAIEPGTFIKAVSKAINLKILLNHDYNKIITDNKKNIDIKEDPNNLIVEVQLDKNNREHHELYKKAQEGLFEGVSFGFTVIKDNWNKDRSFRRVQEIELKEISALTQGVKPAYEKSSVEYRSLESEEYRNMNITKVGGTVKEVNGKNQILDSCENAYEVIKQKINKSSIIEKCQKQTVPHGNVNFAIVEYDKVEVFKVDKCLSIQGSGLKNKDFLPLPNYAVDKFDKGLNNLGIRMNDKLVVDKLSDLMYIATLTRLADTLNDETIKVKSEGTTAKEKIDILLKAMKPQYLIGSIIVINEDDYQELIIAKNNSGKNLIEIQKDKLVYDNMLEVEVIKDIDNITIVNPTCIGQGSNTICHCEEHVTTNNARFGVVEYELLYNTAFVAIDALGCLQIAA